MASRRRRMRWPPVFTLSLAGRRRRPSIGKPYRSSYDSRMRRFITAVACIACWAQGSAGQGKGPLVENVAGTGFIQVESASFAQLTPKQKEVAYWLTQASIAIDPII